MFICETIIICITAYSMLEMYLKHLKWKITGNIPKSFIEEMIEEYNKRYNEKNGE